MDDLDKLVGNALKRLENKDESTEVMELYDWYLVERKSPNFENAMVIMAKVQRDGKEEGWQTGFVTECDFGTGEAMEISGQRYRLRRPLAEYVAALRQNTPEFADMIEKLGEGVDSGS